MTPGGRHSREAFVVRATSPAPGGETMRLVERDPRGTAHAAVQALWVIAVRETDGPEGAALQVHHDALAARARYVIPGCVGEVLYAFDFRFDAEEAARAIDR